MDQEIKMVYLFKDNFKRIKSLLENNISFATIDYRFKNNDDFLLTSFNDAKRALQYLKFYSDKQPAEK